MTAAPTWRRVSDPFSRLNQRTFRVFSLFDAKRLALRASLNVVGVGLLWLQVCIAVLTFRKRGKGGKPAVGGSHVILGGVGVEAEGENGI